MQVLAFFVTFAFIFLVIGFVCFHFFALQVSMASFDAYDCGKKLRNKIINEPVYVMNKEEKTTAIKDKIITTETFILFYLFIGVGFYLLTVINNPVIIIIMCLSFVVPPFVAFIIALSTKDMGIFAKKTEFY